MATVDTRLGASAHFANVLGLLGDRGRASISGAAPVGVLGVFDPELTHASIVLSNGDRTAYLAGTSETRYYNLVVKEGASSGKRYIEFVFDTISNGFMPSAGTMDHTTALTFPASVTELGGGQGYSMRANGSQYGGALTAIFPAFAAGGVLQIAVDIDTLQLWWGKNGTWSGDPAAGTGAAYTGQITAFANPITEAAPLRFGASLYGGASQPARITVNAAPGDFMHTPPTGFSAITA